MKNLDPWLQHRPVRRATTGVILHSTAGGNLSGAIQALREGGNSYGYIVDLDGTVWKCTPSGARQNHAGVSTGWDGPNCNDYSIGISFVNPNDGTPIRKEQYDALNGLLAELCAAYPTLEHIATHYGVTVKASGSYRKSDPRALDLNKVHNGRLKWWKPSYATRFALP